MLLSTHVTSVLFLVRFNNFALTTGFYWSYTLLLKSPVLNCSWLTSVVSIKQWWHSILQVMLGKDPLLTNSRTVITLTETVLFKVISELHRKAFTQCRMDEQANSFYKWRAECSHRFLGIVLTNMVSGSIMVCDAPSLAPRHLKDIGGSFWYRFVCAV